MDIVVVLKALANERRLQILEWLRDPRAHFRRQVDGGSDTAADVVLAVAGQLGRGAWPNVMPVSTSTGSPFTT